MKRFIDAEKAKQVWRTEMGATSFRAAVAVDSVFDSIPFADVVEIPAEGIGHLSDGYHTFNDLYYQRMILFAAIVRQNRKRAWKSLRHEDGELCFGGGWFIVGITTPLGEYTYHYEEKYFDLFDCDALPVGKHWDGHTEKDVTRLLYLPNGGEPKEKKCHFPEGEIFISDADTEIDPCKYIVSEAYKNVTVNVLKCQVCGHTEVEWRRQDNTKRLPEEETA